MPTPRPNFDRVRKARHDLRSILGEIFGFLELLSESAADLGHDALAAEFLALARATHDRVEPLNHVVTVENLGENPSSAAALRDTLIAFAQSTLAATTDLSARSEKLGNAEITEDLARIERIARRLAESAPELLTNLFDPGATSVPSGMPR
jgi:uncharacterized membrane protein YccC